MAAIVSGGDVLILDVLLSIYIKQFNPKLTKLPLKFSVGLANGGSTSSVK